jgi:dipeptidyl-peptidase 4
MRKLAFLLLLLPFFAIAQKKQITLEDIYKKGTFRGEFIPADFGQNSKDPEIKFNDLKDENGKPFGQPEDAVYSTSYPNIVLLKKGIEPIYRHSSKSYTYLYNAAGKQLIKLDTGKIMHPTLSPNGSKIAYVKDNNLYIYDIAGNQHKAVTTDGKWNYVINGNCDWVYEEEFSFTQAYEWSPNGNYLAYYRFDESRVKEYNLTMYNNSYNKEYRG